MNTYAPRAPGPKARRLKSHRSRTFRARWLPPWLLAHQRSLFANLAYRQRREFELIGWGRKSRTPTYGSRTRCPTIRRVPSGWQRKASYHEGRAPTKPIPGGRGAGWRTAVKATNQLNNDSPRMTACELSRLLLGHRSPGPGGNRALGGAAQREPPEATRGW